MKFSTCISSILLGTLALIVEASNGNSIETGEQMALPELRSSSEQSASSEHRVSSTISQSCIAL
jgi:hypothetical protein